VIVQKIVSEDPPRDIVEREAEAAAFYSMKTLSSAAVKLLHSIGLFAGLTNFDVVERPWCVTD
jgi:hypothetical protein